MDTVKRRRGSPRMSGEFMRNCCAFALGVLLVAGAMPPKVVAAGPSLDGEGGFRDAKLGAPLASFRGLKKARAQGGIDYYTRRGDSLTYAGLKLDAIRYGFSGGVLQRIQLHTVKAPEPQICAMSDRVQVLDSALAAYSDALLTHESDPLSPSDPLANQCAAEAGPIEGCAVLVYSAKNVQVQLSVVEEEYKRETSRRVLTSAQVSAVLKNLEAKPLGGRKEPTTGRESAEQKARIAEIEALSGAGAALTRQIMHEELGVPEGAAFYEGRDGGAIAVATRPDGRFDVVTFGFVHLCYHIVEYSLVQPPSGWARKYLEQTEKEKK